MTSCICVGLSWGDLKLVWRRRRLPIPRDPLNVLPPPPDPSEDIDPVLDQEDTAIWYTHKSDKQAELYFFLSFFPTFFLSFFFRFFSSSANVQPRVKGKTARRVIVALALRDLWINGRDTNGYPSEPPTFFAHQTNISECAYENVSSLTLKAHL